MVDYTLLPADILDPVLEGYLEDLRADLTDAALASLFVTNDLRDRSYGMQERWDLSLNAVIANAVAPRRVHKWVERHLGARHALDMYHRLMALAQVICGLSASQA